jgi:ectoine hydroxylase-related dioxygenase (phytanoyl-CoA dioxygenase family)
MSENTLEDISLSKEEAIESNILDMCKEYGICVINSFLDEDQLSAIRSEYQNLYNYEEYGGINNHTEEDYTHALNIEWEDVDKSEFPAIADLVSTPLFESVTREYFIEDDVQYPSNLWAARSKGVPGGPTGDPSDGAPYAYHFDRKNKLKFFFYLTDVEVEDGATHFVPEYHKKYKANRLSWAGEHDPRDISNVIWHYHISDTAEQKEVPVVGDAGTLIIFDTDVPHRAGDLQVGHDREIMRIDTMSPSHSKYYTSQRSVDDIVKEGIKDPVKSLQTLYSKATQ